MKRIGLFGGTFDPIHLGHLRAALEAGIAFQLDPVLVIPSAQPPHKDTKKITSAEDRLEMARLATAAAPRLEVSDIEYGRKGPSYTVETIERLQQKWGTEVELNLIVGLDAFRKYDTWYRFHDLFRITSIIVLIRPEMEALPPSQAGTMLESHLGRTVSNQYRFDPSTRCIMHPRALLMKNGFESELNRFIDVISRRKVIDLVALDLRGMTSVADAFLICSGRSNRHVTAIAEYIRIELKEADIRPLSVEGRSTGHWVILDYGHIVIHIFYEPVRALYDLEGFWADAPRFEIDQGGNDEE